MSEDEQNPIATTMSFIPYQYILHGNMWQLTLSAQYLQHIEMRIITVSDYFTKWVEVIPLPAYGVAETLFKVMIITE